MTMRAGVVFGLLALAVFGGSYALNAGGGDQARLIPGHRAAALDVPQSELRTPAELGSVRAIPQQVASRPRRAAPKAASAPAPAARPQPSSPAATPAPTPVQVAPAPAPVSPSPAPAPRPAPSPAPDGGGQTFDDSG